MNKTSASIVRAGCEVEKDTSGAGQTLRYYVWVSAAEARNKGLAASKYELWAIAERSPCGTAFYNIVLDKLRALEETNYPVTSGERERTSVLRRNMMKELSHWLGLWSIEQTTTEAGTKIKGQPVYKRETIIVSREQEAMDSLAKYRRRSSIAVQSVSRRSSSSASSDVPIGSQPTVSNRSMASTVKRVSIGRVAVKA